MKIGTVVSFRTTEGLEDKFAKLKEYGFDKLPLPEVWHLIPHSVKLLKRNVKNKGLHFIVRPLCIVQTMRP